MYESIGEKIKSLAKAVFYVEAVASVIAAIALMATAENGFMLLLGLLAIVIGPLLAWVSSWLLYAFGEILVKLTLIERNTRPPLGESEEGHPTAAPTEIDSERIRKIKALRDQNLITEEEYLQAISK